MPDIIATGGTRTGAAEVELRGEFLKVDAPKRLVWGWASVVEEGGKPVVDKQGDVITADELRRAAHAFTKSVRAARVNHDGVDLGTVVESCVLTRDLQDALGVDLGKVGWLIGMEMPADVVSKVESGELSMFSVGGRAIRQEIA